MPALPLVIVEHPVGGLRPEEVAAKGAAVVPEVIHALTADREQLGRESESRSMEPKSTQRAKALFR